MHILLTLIIRHPIFDLPPPNTKMPIFDLTESCATSLGQPPVLATPSNPSSGTVTPSGIQLSSGFMTSSTFAEDGAEEDGNGNGDGFDIEAYCTYCERGIALPFASDSPSRVPTPSQVNLSSPALTTATQGPKPKLKKRAHVPVDANGIPQFISPIAPRISTKKVNNNPSAAPGVANLKPALRRSTTAARLQQLAAVNAAADALAAGATATATATDADADAAAATDAAPVQKTRKNSRAVPLNPIRPVTSSLSTDSEYNHELYCSSICARLDAQKAQDLEAKMTALWIQANRIRRKSAQPCSRPHLRRISSAAAASPTNASLPNPSSPPLFFGTRSLSNSNSTSSLPLADPSSSNHYNSFASLDMDQQPDRPPPAQTEDYDFGAGYFDMQVTGVEEGLFARERRRSHASSNGRPGSMIDGPIMKRMGSNQSATSVTDTGYTMRVNPMSMSSSESISSMWSSGVSEGRTFSDDSTGFNAGHGRHHHTFRGLTPLTAATSDPTSPSCVPRSRASFTSPSASDILSSVDSVVTAPLFSDYGLSFHRISSSSDVHLSRRIGPHLDPVHEVERTTRRRQSSAATHTVRHGFEDVTPAIHARPRPSARSSTSDIHHRFPRGGHENINPLNLGTPSSHDGLFQSTPTQTVKQAHSSMPMTRSGSRDSARSHFSGSDCSNNSVLEGEDVSIKRRSTIKASRQSTFSPASKYSLPSTAVSINDMLIKQPNDYVSITFTTRLPSFDEDVQSQSLCSFEDSSVHASPAEPPRREWSYEILEKAGTKMYELPVAALAKKPDECLKLFYFGK